MLSPRFVRPASTAQSTFITDRLLRWCLVLAMVQVVPVHAQDMVLSQAVIAPMHPQAAVKPMLGAVVQWLPGTEVYFERPRRTLHFSGPQSIDPGPLMQILAAHGFQLIHWSGPADPEPARTAIIALPDTISPSWLPLDEDAARKNAWIASDPGRYRALLEAQPRSTE